MRNTLTISAVILFITVLYFSPVIDQAFALKAYNPIISRFVGEDSRICDFIYAIVPYIVAALIIIPLLFILAIYFKFSTAPIKKAQRFALIVYLSLAVGPGLLVNTVFKNNWGRARPYQVLRDHATYTPFWQLNTGHPNDNSFPSGHASIGFFLGIPFLALGYRKKALLTSLAGGTIVGGVRILEGGHYFSDVLLSGIIVYIVAFAVIYLVDRLRIYP